jgi:hypothetical protein
MRGSLATPQRLILTVGVGTLHSLVPATPDSSGAFFLYHVYRNIHNEPLEKFKSVQDFYHSGLDLGKLAEADFNFNWWKKALKAGLREQVQPNDVFTLGLASGDASGNGSGGTLEWVDLGNGHLPNTDAWIGAFNGTFHHFTSNWRELRIVVETLKWEDTVFNKLKVRLLTTPARRVPPKLCLCTSWFRNSTQDTGTHPRMPFGGDSRPGDHHDHSRDRWFEQGNLGQPFEH